MCEVLNTITNIVVGLVTGAVSSYFISTLIQRKIDLKNHSLAKQRLSSYLQHIFDALAIIQQRQELIEDSDDGFTSSLDFSSLIHLLALESEYISVDYVSDEDEQLLKTISEFLEYIRESCYEYNSRSHLKSIEIQQLYNYQNKIVEYSNSVKKITFNKKWWKAI